MLSYITAVKLFVVRKIRLIKFLTIGGSLYVLSAGLMFTFSEWFSLDETSANLYQTLITYVLQFILNACITWADRTVAFVENVKRVIKYVPIKVILWALNQVVFAFWMLFNVHYQLANAFTVLSILAINYLIFDRVIFTVKEET
jgi:putative flippase GtrA